MEQLAIDREIDAVLSDGVVLDGRRFRRPGVTTFEHDWYIMTQVRDAGLLTVAQRFDPLHDDLNDTTAQIIIDAYASGKLFTLLAGVLIEEGTEWRKETTETAARFFASLTKEEDKAALRVTLPFVLLNFFLNADASWRTFLKYSSIGANRPFATGSAPSEASATMANGTLSSAPSEAGTLADTT